MNVRFPLKIVLLYAVLLLAVSGLFFVRGGAQTGLSVAVGGAIALLNGVFGLWAVVYSIDKSNVVFLKMIIGGMGVRLMITAAAVLLVLKTVTIDLGGFLGSLLAVYVISAATEIVFMNRVALRRNLRPADQPRIDHSEKQNNRESLV